MSKANDVFTKKLAEVLGVTHNNLVKAIEVTEKHFKDEDDKKEAELEKLAIEGDENLAKTAVSNPTADELKTLDQAGDAVINDPSDKDEE